MKKTAIVTDSNSGITQSAARELGVFVVPMPFFINEELFYDNMYIDIEFGYDIPFWLDYDVIVDGITKPAYQHMIDIADRVFIMSYRDTAEKIYDISKDEIEYASSINKSVVLGVETYSEEGDIVSFKEEGKRVMIDEINKLKRIIPNNTGICIHHIKRWYDMSD